MTKENIESRVKWWRRGLVTSLVVVGCALLVQVFGSTFLKSPEPPKEYQKAKTTLRELSQVNETINNIHDYSYLSYKNKDVNSVTNYFSRLSYDHDFKGKLGKAQESVVNDLIEMEKTPEYKAYQEQSNIRRKQRDNLYTGTLGTFVFGSAFSMWAYQNIKKNKKKLEDLGKQKDN